MRQRRVKGIDEKLAQFSDLILKTDEPSPTLLPNGRPIRWYERPSGLYAISEGFERIYIEPGCGRGQFINAMAVCDPEGLFIGAEGCKTIVYKAIVKTKSLGLSNVRFIDAFINEPASAFAENSLDGIFLNFSDPWPKDRHEDRRLTAPAKAAGYLHILKTGGFAEFKTDGEAFFDYSLKTFTEAGFEIESSTRDLPESQTIHTEYELRFRSLGQPIYFFRALKPN